LLLVLAVVVVALVVVLVLLLVVLLLVAGGTGGCAESARQPAPPCEPAPHTRAHPPLPPPAPLPLRFSLVAIVAAPCCAVRITEDARGAWDEVDGHWAGGHFTLGRW
jgi:hypothetical protein